MLIDSEQRSIGYLRISLTKACAMRCLYCRPATLEQPVGEPVLSPDEIEQLVRHLVDRHGLAKVRLTGGDPTSRREHIDIIRRVARVPGIRDLAMTTNALTLPHRASEYAEAGLGRVNISLDSLDPERFARMTGVDQLNRVIDGIDAAVRSGLTPVRINCVVIRGENDVELPALVRFAADRGLEVRFIELMPMGPLKSAWADRYVPEAQMRDILDPHVLRWEALDQGHSAARRYRVTLADGSLTTIGFITPMSCNFCAACNRIRVAADGAFFPCLMDTPRGTLLPALRPTYDADLLDELLATGLQKKAREHPHDGVVVMTHIGG